MSRIRDGQLRISTEVWLREDIRNVLIAIDRANGDVACAVPGKEVLIFRAGFRAAIEAMAAAVAVDIPAAPKPRLAIEG